MVETDIRTAVEQEVAALPEEALPTVLALIRTVRQRASDSEHQELVPPSLACTGMAADLSDEEFDVLLSMYHQRDDDTASGLPFPGGKGPGVRSTFPNPGR